MHKDYTVSSASMTFNQMISVNNGALNGSRNSQYLLLIIRVRRKIVGAPHQSATASHRYLFAASVNRGSFYNTSALHWIVMVGGILDALTIFRRSLVISFEITEFIP
jgi:hypothetical protein